LQTLVREKSFARIILHTGDGLLFVDTDEIVRMEAYGNYSYVYLENGDKHLASQSLISLEEILESPPFFRTHQSHIVHVKFIRKLTKKDGESLEMLDKSIVPLARRRKEEFLRVLGK
jgi:two-component system LytT family response regulator